jgi:hypothetical protein
MKNTDTNSTGGEGATLVEQQLMVPPIDDGDPVNPVLAALFGFGHAIRQATRGRVHVRIDTFADADGVYADVVINEAHHAQNGVEILHVKFEITTGFPVMVRNWDCTDDEYVLLHDREQLSTYLTKFGWSERVTGLLRDLSAGSRESWRRGAVLDLDIRAYDVEVHLMTEQFNIMRSNDIWDSQKQQGQVVRTWVASIPRFGDSIHIRREGGVGVFAGVVRGVDHRLGGMHDVAILVELSTF